MQFKKLEDLKSNSNEKNTLENFTDIKEFTVGTPVESENSKITYLDNDRKIVDREHATTAVVQVFDDEGNLIQEVWSKLNEKPFEIEEGTETVTIYVDDNNNEVSEELATYIIYRTTKDGKVIYEDKYSLEKKNNLSR